MVVINLTTNLKLGKPTSDEKYNVQVQNANMDILDASIKKLQDSDTAFATKEYVDSSLSDVKAHANSSHARTDATRTEASSINGNVKINGSETIVYTHPDGTNPHGTTKSDVGLSNVPNVTTNDQTPTFSEDSTRVNIVSGEKLSVILGKIKKWLSDLKAVAFSGSYNDLKDKPDIPSIPTSLKNPNTLTFTGAVTGSYDGSENKTVAIPSGTNSLLATVPGTWLDAVQGKALNDKITSQNTDLTNKISEINSNLNQKITAPNYSNMVDLSGYLVYNTVKTYTPPRAGIISISFYGTDGTNCAISVEHHGLTRYMTVSPQYGVVNTACDFIVDTGNVNIKKLSDKIQLRHAKYIPFK